MQINVINPQIQTVIFSALFFLAIIFSARKIKKEYSFDVSLTGELKGFAILVILFSHIGYFLSKDTQFLFPLSILAGVGVNLFLFLSGFGLTSSSLKSPVSALDFYKKRLTKLFVPMWIVIGVFFVADAFIPQRTYTLSNIFQSFLGWFPRGDLWLDLNSPLWYFTLIFFYYLIFPLLFFKRLPWFSVLFVFLAGILVVRLPLPVVLDTLNLYKLHTLAFPLGMLFAVTLNNNKVQSFFGNLSTRLNLNKLIRQGVYFLLMVFLFTVFVYTAYYSGVGQGLRTEQTISLVTMFSLVFIFLMKKWSFWLFSLFGIYSFEIYLIHWPILSRYDILFKNLPGFLAVLLYLLIFIALGFFLQRLTKTIFWKEKIKE